MARKYLLTHLYDTEEEAQSARTSLMGKFGSLLENTRVVQAPYGFILEIDTKEIAENLSEEIKATIEPRGAPKVSRKPKEPGRSTRAKVTAKPAAKPSEPKTEPEPARRPIGKEPRAKPAEKEPRPKLEPKPTTRAEPVSPAPVTEKPKVPKRKRVAVVLAVFLGPWSWLYTYNKDKHKFWISLIVTVSISVSVSVSAFSNYVWVLTSVLFMWLISIWLWPIINAAARPREFYQEYPSVGTTWLGRPAFAGVVIGSIVLFALLPMLLGSTSQPDTSALGEAVDNPTLVWTTGGDAEWSSQTTTYYYDGVAARSGDVSDGEATWLRATVTGPGTLTFYWRVSSERDSDFLEFRIDGVEQTSISGFADWEQRTYSVTSGTHTLEWRYAKDGSGTSISDCGWLDEVEFTSTPTPAPTTSLGEAVDNTALTWTTDGYAEWFGQANTYYYGGDAARSGAVTNDQDTWLDTTVTGPGTLTFYWKVSCESDYDYLGFYIDGAEQTSISGSVDWQQEIYSITAGTHTLEWIYTKDSEYSSGSDCGWLDKVEFDSTPGSPRSLVFEDDFSNPSSGWFVGSNDVREIAYEDGEYSVLVKKPNYSITGWNLEGGTQTDFSAELDVRAMSTVVGSCAGIMFRHITAQGESSSHYLFCVRSGDGAYRIQKLLSDEWTTLTDWTKSTYIRTGTSVNHLEVICRGGLIEVYANGQKLTSITDLSLASGYVGVVAETGDQSNAHYHVDNFRLYELTS